MLVKDFVNGTRRIVQMLLEWQVGNLKCERWAVSLRHELYKIGLRYIWLDREGEDYEEYMLNNKNQM